MGHVEPSDNVPEQQQVDMPHAATKKIKKDKKPSKGKKSSKKNSKNGDFW
jgi:hypothetical protein